MMHSEKVIPIQISIIIETRVNKGNLLTLADKKGHNNDLQCVAKFWGKGFANYLF